MKIHLPLVSLLIVCMALLSACGGGGSSTSAAAPTPVTTAPAAATASNQLATSVSVSGYSALSIASKTSSTMQTAGIKGLFQNLLARLITPAYAATCTTDAYKLVGVNADGTSTPISVTAGGVDQCGVGFRGMFDAGKYILLTGDSIYKDDLTCNLVFLNKTSGELFCVGETSPAKYDILGQSSWKNYPRLQLSADKNYLFLEAAAVIFDSNNQITGKKTKLMRFDLSDLDKGPQGTVLVEGFQNSWLNTAGSGFSGDVTQFEGFDLNNYAGLDNGDAMVMYNRYVYSVGGTAGTMNPLNRQNNFYYRFETDGTYKRIEVDSTSVANLVTAEMNATGNGGNYGTGAIGNIPCYFKSPNRDKFYFAIPFTSGYSTGGGGGLNYVNRSLIVSATRPSASATSLTVSRYTTSAICANTWGSTTPFQVINGVYYNIDSSWVWDPNTNSSAQRTTLIKKNFGFATETPQADVFYTIDTSSNWWGGRTFYVSKDYLYLKTPFTTQWSAGTTPGDGLQRFDPATFDNTRPVGSQLGTPMSVMASSDNVSIQSIASTSSDNILKVVGRRTDDADLVKVYGTVDEAGLLSWAAQKSTTYSPVTIVKL